MTASSLDKQNARFAEAIGRVNGSFSHPAAKPLPEPIKVAPLRGPSTRPAVPHDPNAILLGDTEYGDPFSMDLGRLLDGRLLIQGVSGAGKSWLLRRLLEQTAGLVQQIVIDKEGEFSTLAELLGYPYIDVRPLDQAAMATLAERVRERRFSVILDFSGLDPAARLVAFAAFVHALVACPERMWTTALVAVDEAHVFAPYGASADISAPEIRKASIHAIGQLMSEGRKRGLIGVLATQRLAKLSKAAASDVHNFVVGKNTLDLDIKRAGEAIGWGTRKASDRLPLLEPGNFVAVGDAFSQSPIMTRIGPVRSRHKGAAPAISAPAVVDAEAARNLLGIDELVEASDADAESNGGGGMPPGYMAVRDFLCDAFFPLATNIVAALRPLSPRGARATQLAETLSVEPAHIAAALALLDRYGIVEMKGAGDTLVARLHAQMLRQRGCL